MAHLIDKDALVAEIKRLRKNQRLDDRHGQGVLDGLHAIERFINTLEVKEVDLERLVDDYFTEWYFDVKPNHYSATVGDVKDIAKHFFELGLRASNSLTWEDVKEICVQSVLVEIDLGGKISDERHYSEVLKRFKETKKVD